MIMMSFNKSSSDNSCCIGARTFHKDDDCGYDDEDKNCNDDTVFL